MGLLDGIAAKIIGTVSPPAGIALTALTWAKRAGRYLLLHPMTIIALALGVYAALEHRSAARWHRADGLAMVALSDVQTAQRVVTANALAAKDKKDAQNTKLAQAGDQTAADLRTRYHAAVVQLAAAQSGARRADLPGDAPAPQGRDGPGQSPRLPADPVTIGTGDALICADNTARLQAVHDWANAMSKDP